MKELDAGLATQLALSCAAGRWDGEDPPADRGVLCKSVLGKGISASSAASAGNLESTIIGLGARVAFPWALKFTGKFWEVHKQYGILQALSQGIGSASGNYSVK